MGRLDFLFFRLKDGWTASTARVEVKYGSDHHPVIGRLALTTGVAMITRLSEPVTRSLGLAAIIAYAGLIGWLWPRNPGALPKRSVVCRPQWARHDIDARRLRTGSRSSAGISSSSRGLRSRADPASRDARTQFYMLTMLSSGLAPDAPRRSAVSRGAKASIRPFDWRPVVGWW